MAAENHELSVVNTDYSTPGTSTAGCLKPKNGEDYVNVERDADYDEMKGDVSLQNRGFGTMFVKGVKASVGTGISLVNYISGRSGSQSPEGTGKEKVADAQPRSHANSQRDGLKVTEEGIEVCA